MHCRQLYAYPHWSGFQTPTLIQIWAGLLWVSKVIQICAAPVGVSINTTIIKHRFFSHRIVCHKKLQERSLYSLDIGLTEDILWDFGLNIACNLYVFVNSTKQNYEQTSMYWIKIFGWMLYIMNPKFNHFSSPKINIYNNPNACTLYIRPITVICM